jgi:diguanylate cyclase (GGDEF)-like protein
MPVDQAARDVAAVRSRPNMVSESVVEAAGDDGFGPWRWLCGHREEFSLEIRMSLMKALLGKTSSIVVGSVSVILLALMAAERLPGSRWPYVWLGLEVFLLLGRLTIIERTRTGVMRGEFAPFNLYTILATLWCTLLGLGACACVITGDVVLVVLAAINISGVAAGISTLSAAFPRLATFQIMLVGLPLAIGAAFNSTPWSFPLATDIAMLLFFMSSLTRMHHTDRVDLIRAERANCFLALHDTLTGLPNRKSLLDRLDQLCVARSADPGAGSFAVLCLDLDGFKAVNDTFGHPVGDQLLIAVALRLMRETRECDVVARIGGDEFIILLQDADDDCAALTSQRIIDAIARPVEVGLATELMISVTIGSAFSPRDASLADLLLSRADQALYVAKREQRGTYRTYAQVSHLAPGPVQVNL